MEIMLRRVVPSLVNVLTAVVSSRVIAHVIRVIKEEKGRKLAGKLVKSCW